MFALQIKSYSHSTVSTPMNILSNKITITPEEVKTITTFKNKYFPMHSKMPNMHTLWRIRHNKINPDDITSIKNALFSIIKNNCFTNFDNIDYIEFHNINRQMGYRQNVPNIVDTFNGQDDSEQILKSIVPANMAFCKVIFYFVSFPHEASIASLPPTSRFIGHNLTIPDWDEYELGRTLSISPQTGTNICCHVINESDTFAYTPLVETGEIDSIIVNCVVERKATKGKKRKNSCDADSLTNAVKNLRVGDEIGECDVANTPLSF